MSQPRSLLCSLLLMVGTVALAPALAIGDQAPALDGVDWIKKEAPAFSEQITVVEFWATWCPPCLKSIPHLTELQKQYGDQVAIVGISREQEAGKVKSFVQKQGDNMDYAVGLWQGEQANAYMEGIGGIPHAFIVGTDGKLLWHGHPMNMDAVLAKAVAGTLDPSRMKQVMAKEEALRGTFKSNNLDQIGAAADALLAVDPTNDLGLDVAAAIAKERQDPAAYRAVFAGIDASALSGGQAAGLVDQLLSETDFAYREPGLALDFAKVAVEQSPELAAAHAAMARVHYALGEVDAAIAAIKQAIALGGDHATTLSYFEKVQKLAGQ